MLYRGLYRVESARLPGHGYDDGYYHVTLCTAERTPWFGRLADGRVVHSQLGWWAHTSCGTLSERRGVEDVPAYIVMPEHVHLVLGLRPVAGDPGCRGRGSPGVGLDQRMSEISPAAGSLGAVVRGYKSAVARWAHLHGYSGFAWQARYHDQVIRSQRQLEDTCHYVLSNPQRARGRHANSTLGTAP